MLRLSSKFEVNCPRPLGIEDALAGAERERFEITWPGEPAHVAPLPI